MQENTNTQSYQINPMLWGTIGYLFLMIFRPFEYWEWLGTYHIERIYMIGLLVAVILWPGKRYISHNITIALLFFFVVMGLSTIFAYDIDIAWDQMWKQIKLLLLFFVIMLTVRTREDFKVLIIAFWLVLAIYIGKSMWEFFLHDRHVYRMGIRRLIGIDQTYNDPNTFAATVVYSLPFAWALWKTEESRNMKIALITYGLMCLSAIGLTGSRMGMLSFIFFIILIWARGRNKIIGVISAVCLIIASWFFLPDEYKDRFRTLYDDSINESATESAESRLTHIEWGFMLYGQRPVLGWGPGCAPLVVNEVIGEGRNLQLHNFTAQLITELGSLGVISVFLLIYILLRTKKQILYLTKYQHGSRDFLANIAIACSNTVFLLLFQGLSGHNLYRYTWFILAVVLLLAEYFAFIQVYTEQNDKKLAESDSRKSSPGTNTLFYN